jgi:5-methyltetrahydrofolate--homocysteine methyltransferase
MVPCEKIMETAVQEHVDIIGLSGLITPSLEEMAHVASEMDRLGFKIPLLIGGATTSKIHTAVKLEQVYRHPVIHVKDASKSVPVVSSLLSKTLRNDYIKHVKKEYNELRESYAGAKSKQNYISLNEARKNKLLIDWKKEQIHKPNFLGIKAFEDYPLEEIREYISWIFFFIVWQLKGKFPDIFNDPEKGTEARKLYDDANRLLDDIISKKLIKANAVFGILPANSIGDDIEVYSDEKRTSTLAVFYNLRNQVSKSEREPNLCLSDFIAPRESGLTDYLGFFAVTAGIGADVLIKNYKTNLDDYNAIMIEALTDRLAEAFTELLHKRIRKEFWGYQSSEQLTLDDLLLEKYKGIRPAHGYPACPDHSEKKTLFNLLQVAEKTGISLTESCSMMPAASVSGLIFANTQSRYFYVDKISHDQVEDYSKRKGISSATAEKWLSQNINYL